MSVGSRLWVAVCAAGLGLAPLSVVQAATDQQSVEELRNTVVNLLRALVDQGVITREKAEAMVKQAEEKAAADAQAVARQAAASDKLEPGEIRVPYVPQIVKDEISKQVAKDVQPTVVASVLEKAKAERWGVPGSLPEWLDRVKVAGEVTLRAQADLYPKDNVPNEILDFNAINQAGGFGKVAPPNAFLNVTQNRDRMRLRARLGVEAQLTPTLSAGVRLASGSLTDPSSESQTLGTSSDRYTVGIDQAYLRKDSQPAGQFSHFSIVGGRFASPWFAPTELVFSRDLQFEGIAATERFGLHGQGADRSQVFLTLGAFPVLEVPLVNKQSKWLLAAQLGTSLRWGSDERQRLRLAAAYYDFLHVTGVRNTPDSTLLNYTAPAFIRYGNSVFDISNSTTDPTINLFGLASHFRIADVAANYEVGFARYSAALTAEAVRNLGYQKASIDALSAPLVFPSGNNGYVAEFSFGDPSVNRARLWRARIGYRYVKSDAVLDAWTDTDFHGGGTNAAGYYLWTDIGLAHDTWLRLRYLSANEIDGPRYGFDMFQFDLNARF